MVEALSRLEETAQKILMVDWQAKYDGADFLLQNWTNKVTYKSNLCFLKQYIYEKQGSKNNYYRPAHEKKLRTTSLS